jgi:hypothetical protein
VAVHAENSSQKLLLEAARIFQDRIFLWHKFLPPVLYMFCSRRNLEDPIDRKVETDPQEKLGGCSALAY